jgi:hypothetical protein
MSHTNSTTNYHLPQFESTDKPAWLTDVNDAMYAIDNGIAAAQSTADGNTTALADKVDKVAGKGLSENDYTTADKTKLEDLANIKSIGSNLTLVTATGELSATDTTYSNFTGTDGTAAGAAGLVPAPATTDAGKFLKADGTWDTAGGGGGTLYTTIGQNTDGAMTQKATTDMVFAGGDASKIVIGSNANGTGSNSITIGPNADNATYQNAIAIGNSSKGYTGCIAIGQYAKATSGKGVYIGKGNVTGSMYSAGIGIGNEIVNKSDSCICIGEKSEIDAANIYNAISLGRYSKATRTGEVNVGMTIASGFNNTNYRVIGGVHDGQEDHDVATVGQWKTSLTIAATAPSTPVDGELILYTGAVDSTFTASPAIYVYSASNTSWTHLTLQ